MSLVWSRVRLSDHPGKEIHQTTVYSKLKLQRKDWTENQDLRVIVIYRYVHINIFIVYITFYSISRMFPVVSIKSPSLKPLFNSRPSSRENEKGLSPEPSSRRTNQYTMKGNSPQWHFRALYNPLSSHFFLLDHLKPSWLQKAHFLTNISPGTPNGCDACRTDQSDIFKY